MYTLNSEFLYRKIFILFIVTIILSSCNTNNEQFSKSITDYIPNNSNIVFKINNLKEVKKSFKENSNINNTHIINIMEYFTSLPEQKEVKIDNSLLCFSEIDKNKFAYTLISKLSYQIPQNDSYKRIEVENNKKEKVSFLAKKYGDSNIYSLQKDSILITSSSQKIIEKIIRNEVELTTSENFKKVYEKCSNKSSMSILLNGKSSIEIYNELFPEYHIKNNVLFNGWANLSINITENNIIAKSKIDANLSDNCILGIFNNLSSKKSRVAEVAPSTCLGFISFTYDNYGMLKENLAKFQKRDILQIPNTLDDLLTATEEIASLSLGTDTALILRSNNTFDIEKKYTTKKISSFSGTDIYHFDTPNAFKKILTPLISEVSTKYYFFHREYIIYANSIDVLKTFIIHIKNNKTIKQQEWYTNALEIIPNKASLFIFRTPCNLKREIYNGVKKKYQNLWKGFDLHKRHTKIISVQKNNASGQTNIKLLFNRSKDDHTGSVVHNVNSIFLQNDLANQPLLVKNSLRKEPDIIVQDVKNQLFLFSEKGDTIWKKQLDNRILGTVQQISYNNGRDQYFTFSTKSSLYLLDNYGNHLKNFPKKFEKKLTQPLVILDYRKNENYRFLVTQGNQILSYNIRGKKIEGFHSKAVKTNLITPPKYIKIKRNGYIILQEENGQLQIVNQYGKKIIKVKDKFQFSGNEWYKLGTNFVSTNTTGELISVDRSGVVKLKDLNLNPKHKFLIHKELIVIRSDETLFIGETKIPLEKGKIYSDPTIVKIDNNFYISIADLESKKVFLYDKQGFLFPSFPVKGSSGISLGNMVNKTKTVFVVKGESNEILIYKI